MCTYNCGETNGDSGTLGATPFALQEEGFPANKSMRFLMFSAPVLIWDTNPMLRTRFPDWRKFTDAYAEKFGMFDLMSIALPKVTGVTMDLIKYMQKADEEKFELWVKAPRTTSPPTSGSAAARPTPWESSTPAGWTRTRTRGCSS